MPDTSLAGELSTLRMRYTGEPRSIAKPMVQAVLREFSNTDRALVIGMLRRCATVAGPPVSCPAMPLARLRALLLHDAQALAQQQLETGLLQAAGEAANAMLWRAPAGARSRPTVFRSITPTSTGGLEVRIDPMGLGPLLKTLLPYQTGDDELDGIAGLRYQHDGRHLVLWLVDTGPVANVCIRDVARDELRAALAYVCAEHSRGGQIWQRVWSGGRVTAAERAELAVPWKRVLGDPVTGSGLLRRYFAFGDAWRVKTWCAGSGRQLEWTGGASLDEVAVRLTHPLFGLPRRYRVEHFGGSAGLLAGSRTVGLEHEDVHLRPEPLPAGVEAGTARRTLPMSESWQRWAEARQRPQRRRR